MGNRARYQIHVRQQGGSQGFSPLITQAWRRTAFELPGTQRLPQGFLEIRGDQGHGTIDRNLQILVEHNRDLVLIDFHKETDEMRVDCDALPSSAFREKAQSVRHVETSHCFLLTIYGKDRLRDRGVNGSGFQTETRRALNKKILD
jgi:hypothetical protein